MAYKNRESKTWKRGKGKNEPKKGGEQKGGNAWRQLGNTCKGGGGKIRGETHVVMEVLSAPPLTVRGEKKDTTTGGARPRGPPIWKMREKKCRAFLQHYEG